MLAEQPRESPVVKNSGGPGQVCVAHRQHGHAVGAEQRGHAAQTAGQLVGGEPLEQIQGDHPVETSGLRGE